MKKEAKTLMNDFISLFFPHYCLGCMGAMVKGEEVLCTRCISQLPKTNSHLMSVNPLVNKLTGRLLIKYGWSYLKFRKGGMVQHLLHQLKYNNHPEVGIKLGKAFGLELAKSGFLEAFDLIIPVPLHRSRIRQRGYNQSTQFAIGLSEAIHTPWDESISIRTQSSSTQTRKSKTERWENVKSAFSMSSRIDLKGKRVLLVDDVITTGATIEACGQHLLSHGCNELSIACIAEAQ
jgi:ComF family protein